jgi:hypothetical protein
VWRVEGGRVGVEGWRVVGKVRESGKQEYGQLGPLQGLQR